MPTQGTVGLSWSSCPAAEFFLLPFRQDLSGSSGNQHVLAGNGKNKRETWTKLAPRLPLVYFLVATPFHEREGSTFASYARISSMKLIPTGTPCFRQW